jgi:hypothetical protein
MHILTQNYQTWSTPLHLAAKANQISAVKLLREMGKILTVSQMFIFLI